MKIQAKPHGRLQACNHAQISSKLKGLGGQIYNCLDRMLAIIIACSSYLTSLHAVQLFMLLLSSADFFQN